MNRKPVVETEIETGIGKPRRLQERFLKGPILIKHIARAANLPGGSLGVYLAIHHQTALTKKPKVTLPKGLLAQLGISRDAKARALKHLDKAGLVVVENQKGRAARVMLSPDRDPQRSDTASFVVNHQWEVFEDGIRCTQRDYFIPRSQLAELRDADFGLAMWPLQMAEKSWVDLEAFIAAYDNALVVHKPTGIEQINLHKTYGNARHLAQLLVPKSF